MVDLFFEGQLALATTRRITEFKQRIASGTPADEELLDDQMALVANESEGGVFWNRGDPEPDNAECDEDETCL